MGKSLYTINDSGEVIYEISTLAKMANINVKKILNQLDYFNIEHQGNIITLNDLNKYTKGNSLLIIYYNYCQKNNITPETFPELKYFFNDFYINAQYFAKNGYIDLDFLMMGWYLDDALYYLKINGDVFFSYSFLRIVTTDEFKERLKNSPSYTRPAQRTYIMKDGTGYYKIGKSQDPSLRESTIKTGNPTIKLIAVIDANIEHELHQEYKLFNVRGKWFQLSDRQIKEIIHKHKFKKI